MAITTLPEIAQKSASVYINAGITYVGGYQTFSGNIGLFPHSQNLSNYSGTGTGYIKVLLSGNTTITWSNTVNTYGSEWFLEIANPSTYTLSFNGVTWAGGSAPVAKTNGRSVYMFFSPDGGTTIYGKQIMSNLAGVA